MYTYELGCDVVGFWVKVKCVAVVINYELLSPCLPLSPLASKLDQILIVGYINIYPHRTKAYGHAVILF